MHQRIASSAAKGPAAFLQPPAGPLRALQWALLLLASAAVAPGYSAPRLAQSAIEEAAAYAEAHASSALLVQQGGELVAEYNFDFWHRDHQQAVSRLPELHQFLFATLYLGDTDDGRAREDVASVQKSVIAVLVGIAMDQGLLAIDDRVNRYLQPGWSTLPEEEESQITIRHLLSMTSGLGWKMEKVGDLGHHFYATPPYGRLHLVLEAASGMPLPDYSRKWLTGPLGMQETDWIIRPEAYRATNKYGLASTARDLAKFGQLILNRGEWRGEQLVSRAWLDEALSSSQEQNPAYGYLFWLNGKPLHTEMTSTGIVNGEVCAAGPPDMVIAMGAGDRRIYVVPSMDLVVVRLGMFGYLNEPEKMKTWGYFDNGLWSRLLPAVEEGDNP